MARIIIAGATEASRGQLARLLTASGFDVFRLCGSDSELRRALNACGDGILLLAGAVPGCLPDALAGDFGGAFQILLVGRPEALEACESPEIFKLTYPCPGSAVVGATEMLSQLHYRHMPKRSEEERAIIDRAKAILMEREGLTEPQAHRRMQQQAMRRNMKMTDYAEEIIDHPNGD